jgi:hypothetical protein
MADAQAIANALTAVLQPMAAAITVATAAAIAMAAPAPPGPGAAVIFAHTPAQAQADLPSYELPGDAKIYLSTTTKLSTTFFLNKPNVSILLTKLGTAPCGQPPSRSVLGQYWQHLEWQPYWHCQWISSRTMVS